MKAILSALALFLIPMAPIQTTQDFEVYALGSRVYTLKTRPGLGNATGSNSGFIKLKNKVVVIDTHTTVEVETRAQGVVTQTTGLPIGEIINTHFHLDHCGGNPSYAASVPVWAQANSVIEMKKDHPERDYRALTEDQLDWQGEGIDIIVVGPAHSKGDLVVYDRVDKVLFTGDMFVNSYLGYLSEGTFKPWIAALKRFEQLDAVTVMPGHGPISTLEDLKRFRVYLQDFVASTKKHFDAGGLPATYQLPEQYKSWGSQYYLADNVARAYELWKIGELGE